MGFWRDTLIKKYPVTTIACPNHISHTRAVQKHVQAFSRSVYVKSVFMPIGSIQSVILSRWGHVHRSAPLRFKLQQLSQQKGNPYLMLWWDVP